MLPEPVLQQEFHEDDAWSDVEMHPPWNAFNGGTCLWWWRLTNQSGYVDGAQVHLVAAGNSSTEIEVQWMVEASALRASVLVNLP